MTTKISLSVDPRVTRRILDCGQLWATGNGFCPVFIFIYLWKLTCSLCMSQDNMQQLLLFFYTFVHVFVNILIAWLSKTKRTFIFKKKMTIAGNNPFVCLYTYEFWLSLCKIVRSSVILFLPLFITRQTFHFSRTRKRTV
jgi:hypothetical protein